MEDFEANILTVSEENVQEALAAQTASAEEARERLNALLQENEDGE